MSLSFAKTKREKETFTCPNPLCRKVFANPLKTLNLQSSAAPYQACPYCLTKIVDSYVELSEHQPIKVNDDSSKEKSIKNKEKPASCNHHLGYLSERAEKQQIPDECMVCKDLLSCMLQKMRA